MAANKTSKAIPIFVIALVVTGLFIYFTFFHTKEHDWYTMNYQYNSKEPYGTSVLYSFLKSSQKDDDFEKIDKSISNILIDKKIKNTNYIVINEALYYSLSEMNDLLAYVKRGNTALIIVDDLDADLESTVNGIKHVIEKVEEEDIEEEVEEYVDTVKATVEESEVIVIEDGDTIYSVVEHQTEISQAENKRHFKGAISFTDPALQKDNPHVFYNLKKLDTIKHQWNYLDELNTTLLNYKTLATINEENPTFIEVNAGKGRFLIHYNPIAFSNLHLLRKDGKTHLAKVLSYLKPGKIYWDNYSFNFRFDFSGMGYSTDTPLSYILSKPSLAWAFYILLACSLLFVIFNAKRIQQSIPLLPPKVNSSLEYIRSVGRLYFQHRKNQDLIERMMQQFYTDVYMRYKIKERNRENFIKKLSSRSGVEPELIAGILNYYDSIEEAIMAPDEKILTHFYQKIQEFNAKRK